MNNTLTLQIIGNVVNFAIFAFVMVKYAGPAIKKVLADRHEATMLAIRTSEEAKRQAQESLAATQARLAGADAEFAKLIENAKQIAASQGAAIEAASKSEAERLKAGARAEIERERQAAVQEIRQAVMRQAFERATVELQQQMSPERQRELVAGLIQKVGDGSLALK
ncbi:ATP synthase subunit b, sodium ion specific [compost metagenome]